MLKALQILEDHKKYIETLRETSITIKLLKQTKQAIAELEDLQLNLYSKKCEDISNMFKDGTNENITFKKLSNALNNRSCENCKNSSFEMKFGELEFNSCFLVSNSKPCKWETK